MKERETDIRRWFKDHVATLLTPLDESDGGTMFKVEGFIPPRAPVFQPSCLHWGNRDGSGAYFIQYVWTGGCLYVSGDVGDAVFSWHQVLDLKWLAGLDVDYFAGKCQGSETGRGYKEWDQRKAFETATSLILDGKPKNKLEKCIDNLMGDEVGIVGVSELKDACFSQGDWSDLLGEHGERLFGGDYFEYGDIGMGVSLRCESMLIGLKMAHQQLTQENSDATKQEAEAE